MNTAVLDQIRTERDQARSAALAIAEGENFDPGDENYKALEERAETLDKRAASLADLFEKQAAADALDGRLSKSLKAAEDRTAAARDDAAKGVQTRQSWGEMFVRSEVFGDYRGRGSSGIFQIDEEPLFTRALPTGISDLIAAGFTPTPTRVDATPPPAPTPILDAMTTVTVSTNSIEYVSWHGGTGADIVPEKGVKPPSEFTPTVTPDTLQTIAHYTQLTRQLVEDLPAVRSMIDTELRAGVLRREEQEAAEAITGATTSVATADTLLAAIRVGVGNVQSVGYQPNAVLLNPADYADLDIQVMGVTSNGPQISGGYWGLTPIPSSQVDAGTVIVGDFRNAVTHFVRSGVQLYVTDSHAETFLSNVFTLLAERRAKTAVIRPYALCKCSVTAPETPETPEVQSARASRK